MLTVKAVKSEFKRKVLKKTRSSFINDEFWLPLECIERNQYLSPQKDILPSWMREFLFLVLAAPKVCHFGHKVLIFVNEFWIFLPKLTCQPWRSKLLSTVLSHMTASPAWKSRSLVHLLCRNSPRHLSNSDVEAWITVFLGPGVKDFCANFLHVGLCVVWLLFEAGAFVWDE